MTQLAGSFDFTKPHNSYAQSLALIGRLTGEGENTLGITGGLEGALAKLEGLGDEEDVWATRLGNIGAGVGIASDLGRLFQGFQQLKLAKKDLGLRRRAFEVNTQNQWAAIKAQIEDTMNARYFVQGTPGQAAGAISERLSHFKKG